MRAEGSGCHFQRACRPRLCVSREECCPFSPPHRCKTEAARDALSGRFLLVSIPLQFVRKAPQVSAFTFNNNSLRLTRRLLSEQYYTYFKKVSLLYETYISVLCVSLILSKHEIIR